MRLHSSTADLFIPDRAPMPGALRRITHLGIGAHPDDLEFMAFHGIMECFHHERDAWFGGVTCTTGSGSPRAGAYAHFTDEQMAQTRAAEQRTAASIGHYAVIIQLSHTSTAVKSTRDDTLALDLAEILASARPSIVYTHSLADKHDTHVAVTRAVIQAIRSLPAGARPEQLLGCEMWRGHDWLDDAGKVILNVSGHDGLAADLNRVFDSQISGGKRYDIAAPGRRAANATFLDPHTPDTATQLCLAMNLTPLVLDDTLDPVEFTLSAINRFHTDVQTRLKSQFPGHE